MEFMNGTIEKTGRRAQYSVSSFISALEGGKRQGLENRHISSGSKLGCSLEKKMRGGKNQN